MASERTGTDYRNSELISVIDTERHLQVMTNRLMRHFPVGGWLEVIAYQFWDTNLAPAVLYPSPADKFWWSYRMMSTVANRPVELQLSWFNQARYRYGYSSITHSKLYNDPYRSLYRYDRSVQTNWRWICHALRDLSNKPPLLQVIAYGHPQNIVMDSLKLHIVRFIPNLRSIWQWQRRSWFKLARGEQ